MKNGERETNPRYGTVNFERRKYPRFSVDLWVEYCRIDSSVFHTGRGLNIGEDGLLVYFPEQMEASQYLKLKLFLLMGSELDTIEVLGEVVWMNIDLDKDRGGSRGGVKFIDISPEDMTKLEKFLGSLSG